MRWSWWSMRMVISWLDRNPWAEVAFAVPVTLVLLAALAAHPFLLVFVALPVLGVVALAVMDFYEAQKSEVVHDAQVAGPQRRNPLSRADGAMAQPERMLSQRELEARARAQVAEAEALAAEARVRAIRLRV